MDQVFRGYDIFPIKSETACLLKWSWSTVNLQRGSTSSCHRVFSDPISLEDFSDFHNSEPKLKAREIMRQGQWPGRGCEYCARVEQHGGTSDRIMSLERYHVIDKIPPELLSDPNSVKVTPTILEVYFNNTCNLSCVYCTPEISSKINDEIKKHGDVMLGNGYQLKPFIPSHDDYQKYVDKLWEYLENNDRYKVIRHFNVLGGEPLLQRELDQTINFWRNHPNPSLTINLITNLALPYKLFVDKIEKFRKLVKDECIYTLEITASIDCWGPEQEYTRYGLDLESWQKNFEYLVQQDWLNLAVHSCINALSIKSMPTLLEHINSWNQQRDQPINFSFDLPIGTQWLHVGMHPAAFGAGVFDDDFEKILELMPETTVDQKTSKQQIRGISEYIKKTPRDPEKIQRLKKYLSTLDQRRGTRWQSLFPWLEEI